MFTLVLLALIKVLEEGHGAEILAATMPQGKSHAGSMAPLLEELVRQGHNVTIYMEQYGEAVDFGGSLKRWYINITEHPLPHGNQNFTHELWHHDFDPGTMSTIYYYSSVSCDHVLTDHRAEYERIVAYPWDLVLTDSLFTACGYGIAQLSKASHVIMYTSSVEEFHAMAKCFGRQYVIAPPYFMNSRNAKFDVRYFFDRLGVVYELLDMWFMFGIIANYHMAKSLAPMVPNFDFSTYCGTAAMSFSDMAQQLYVPEPINNELFTYGGYCKPFNKLGGELADFVEDPQSNGIILLAFGTVLRFGEMPHEWLEAYVEALNQLTDYRIIWGCRFCLSMKVAKHVRILDWVPQTDILNHPKTRLFIMHGGMKREAACAKMPTLFMPVAGEEVRNSWLGKLYRFGRIIPRFNITGDYLLEVIREMLGNPIYKQRAEKVQRYFEDAPISPLKEGAFRIGRLLKYGGRMPEYFYTRCTNFGYIRNLNLDLLLIIPFAIYILLLTK